MTPADGFFPTPAETAKAALASSRWDPPEFGSREALLAPRDTFTPTYTRWRATSMTFGPVVKVPVTVVAVLFAGHAIWSGIAAMARDPLLGSFTLAGNGLQVALTGIGMRTLWRPARSTRNS